MNRDTSLGQMRWIPFTHYYPPNYWNRPHTLNSSSQAWNEKTIIRCDGINKVPGLEHVVYPSSKYAATVFGEYNMWGPPSQAELNFWNSLKTMRKKFAASHRDKSKAVCDQNSKEDLIKKESEEQAAGLGQEFKRLVLLRTQEEVASYEKITTNSGSGFPSIDWPPISGNEHAFEYHNYYTHSAHGPRLCTHFTKSNSTVTEEPFISEEEDEEENEEINEDEVTAQTVIAHTSSWSSSFSSDSLSSKTEYHRATSFRACANSNLQQLDEEISQDVEVQELLKDERRMAKSFEKRRGSRDKESKKDRPIIEIREGDNWPDPGEREFLCVFCKGNNEPEIVYKSHPIRINGVVMCPFLRNHTCHICKETGHTIKYCKENKRGFFAMKSIGKADIFLTAEKNKLAEATTTALVEATNSGLIPQIVDDKENRKVENQSQAKKQSRIPLAPIPYVINRGNPQDSVEGEYVPIGRYDVKNIPINASTQTTTSSTSNRRRVRRSS